MSESRTSTLPKENKIRRVVREHYAKLAQTETGRQSCCGPSVSQSDAAPAEARQVYAGCGFPVETASIKEGDVVVDLGSGGGFDVFKASKLVGASGRVIGVDATPEMILRARETAHRHAYSNVEFRLGEIEHLPVDSSSVDLVISNCVINLAPDKSVVFREAYRVLKPGGRLVVSDMVTDGAVKIKQEDLNKWAECVAGALPENEYLAKIKAAGFADVDLRPESEAQGCCSTGIASVTVTATKPKTS